MNKTTTLPNNPYKKTKENMNIAFSNLGKVPPQAIEIEEAVLGALMLEQKALSTVIDILKPDIFYTEAHKLIFKAIFDLNKVGKPVDILTVTNELKRTGKLEEVGGAYYITKLTNRVVSGANIEFHTRILTQKYIQRELIRISSEIIKDSYEDKTDVFDLLDKAESRLFSISEKNFRRDYDDMESLIKTAIDEIKAAKESEGSFIGIGSGFTNLDAVTSGWQKSDLIVLAGRPGMGKTALALTLCRNAAVLFNKPVAFFSLEMSSIQLVTRLISSETEISSEKLRKGDLGNNDWDRLNEKISSLVEAPIFIDDTPALSIFELRAKCRRLKEQHGIEMVLIDYLQLMNTAGENKGNREQEISTISRSLKALAKELNIAIIVLSQLNRSVETRAGSKKPILSDLRESGAIEQDADLVIFIYRPEYYKIDKDEDGNSLKDIAQIIIAKHRNGPLKDINLSFKSRFAKFNNIENTENIEQDDNFDLTPNEEFGLKQTITRQSKMNDDAPPF